MFVYNML